MPAAPRFQVDPEYRGPTPGAVNAYGGGGLARGAARIANTISSNRLMQQKQAAAAYQANQKKFEEYMEYSAESPIGVYSGAISDEVAEFQNDAAESFKNDNFYTPDEQLRLANKKNGINTKLNILKSFQAKQQQIYEIAKTNKGNELNTGFITGVLGNTVFDQNGDIRPIEQLKEKESELTNVFKDPRAYNWTALAKNISDDIAATVNEEVSLESVGGVQTLQEVETKSKFVERNLDGTVAYDENGDPKIKVTPAVLNRFLFNEGAKVVIESEYAKLKEKYPQATKLDALARLIKGSEVVERKLNVSRIPEGQGPERIADENNTYNAARDIIYNLNEDRVGEGYNVSDNVKIEYTEDPGTGGQLPSAILVKRREPEEVFIKDPVTGLKNVKTKQYNWVVADEIPIKTERQKEIAEGKIFNILSETQGSSGNAFRRAKQRYIKKNPKQNLRETMNNLWK